MTAYILRRLILIFPTLLGIMTLNFFVIQIAPGGPVEQMIAKLQGTEISSTERISGGGEDIKSSSGSKSGGESKYRGAQGLEPELVQEIEKMYEYKLPKNLIGIIWKGKYRGQKQKWFITKFTGNENEINLNTEHPEFIEWKWIDVEMLPSVIVEFKKNLYLDLLEEIKLVIG